MNHDIRAAELPIPEFVVIYRGASVSDTVEATEHLLAEGFTCFEVSLTSPEALESIAALQHEFGTTALIGAGTVRSTAQVAAVVGAGARLLLSPETDPEVIAASRSQGLITIPGAYTPTEISRAHRAGADVVKLFPAATVEPGYLRLLSEPLPEIPILVTGGVDAQLAGRFFAAGAVSVGIGLGIIDRQAASAKDWKGLARAASEYRRTAYDVRDGATDRKGGAK